MASIQARVSRGKKYWSIVESKRINGKPRTIILQYLGTAEVLLSKLQTESKLILKSYAHGDVRALLDVAAELDIVDIINKRAPHDKHGKVIMRNDLTVGCSLLLAAIGRACRPTSKKGWYDWCKETSLEYCLQSSYKEIDSQHFWDHMNVIPSDAIPKIEEEIVLKLIEKYEIKPDSLFFDTTNFFTFINSTNSHCAIAQRGKNKQKRTDLRQIGMALLASKEEQFPLFHKTYQGNKNDVTVFKEIFNELRERLKKITKKLADVTIVFDKGNNSKKNFSDLDDEEDLYYVTGLVSSHFKDLIQEANENFSTIKISGKDIQLYRVSKEIWNKNRTCIVIVSDNLKEGQLRGIQQHLDKKIKILEKFKQVLENKKRKNTRTKEYILERLKTIIKGQFIDSILKYDLIQLQENLYSFNYYVDQSAFEKLQQEILGRQIIITNRSEWTSEEIVLAYRGQSNVENAFRNIKNPYHLAIRPQYHWTDHKIEVHFIICMIGYLLTMVIYNKARKNANYQGSVSHFMEDLKSIRLACIVEKKNQKKVRYQLESIHPNLSQLCKILNITNSNIRPQISSFQ